MRKLGEFRFLLLAWACAGALAPALAQAAYSDCRTCHFDTTPENTAPDLTGYFIQPGHHPVRVNYPARADFKQPGGTEAGILYFDQNGNGALDPDEIQIFSSALTSGSVSASATRTRAPRKTQLDTWVIDCASCHAEHGATAPEPDHPPDYVRPAGGEQFLCVTCHNL